MSAQGFVSIVVPALNEEAYIERVISTLLPEEDSEIELLVLDGGSTDRTRAIVLRMAAADRRIRLLDNPKRFQSAAMNVAAREADPRADVLVRCDAHCSYPAGYVRGVEQALRASGAQSVVVPMLTTGDETCFQRAVVAAQNSRLGNGGAAHRIAAKRSGWIDHGHHAAFDRAFFRSIGGYDETFAVNEDAEYDVRVHKAGGRVWMETSAVIEYHPRKSFQSLWVQYFRYGRGRAGTLLKHRVRPKARQMIPVVAISACALSMAASPFLPVALAVPAAYIAGCALAGAAQGFAGGTCAAAAGVPLVAMHISWTLGFASKMLPSLLRLAFKNVDGSTRSHHPST